MINDGSNQFLVFELLTEHEKAVITLNAKLSDGENQQEEQEEQQQQQQQQQQQEEQQQQQQEQQQQEEEQQQQEQEEEKDDKRKEDIDKALNNVRLQISSLREGVEYETEQRIFKELENIKNLDNTLTLQERSILQNKLQDLKILLQKKCTHCSKFTEDECQNYNHRCSLSLDTDGKLNCKPIQTYYDYTNGEAVGFPRKQSTQLNYHSKSRKVQLPKVGIHSSASDKGGEDRWSPYPRPPSLSEIPPSIARKKAY